MVFLALLLYEKKGNTLFSMTYNKGERINFMGQIQVERTDIEGLCIITPTIHQDSRGYFMESYNEKDLRSRDLTFVLYKIIRVYL